METENVSRLVDAINRLTGELIRLRESLVVSTGLQQVSASDPINFQPIHLLSLSGEVIHLLHGENIYYIGELVLLSEEKMREFPNMRQHHVRAIEKVLATRGLMLGMKKGW